MRVSVKVIISHKGKILLLQPKNTQNSLNGWDGPGGAVEEGESIDQAAIREVFEETGINIKNLTYLQPLVLSNNPAQYELFYGEAEADTVLLSNEHVGYKWTNMEKVQQLTGINLKPFLAKFRN
jgi:ADP-ribose pyrophosphatase YjhB (NUDIX family)